MPQDKDLKRLVRARMAETGERYTAAKAVLDNRQRELPPEPPYVEWVEALAHVDGMHAAFARLKALPSDVLVGLAVTGTHHRDWRVRRSCCRLLDDLAFTPESLAALQRCLDDDEPRVRRAALHTLACQHCKPEGCVVDVRSVFERMVDDPSRKVRSMVVGPLTWSTDEPWALELLRHVARSDRSEALRVAAESGIESIEQKRSTDRERRHLPPDLVAKTDRHPNKWVAISGGRIVDVGWGASAAALERAADRQGRRDVRYYWVAANTG